MVIIDSMRALFNGKGVNDEVFSGVFNGASESVKWGEMGYPSPFILRTSAKEIEGFGMVVEVYISGSVLPHYGVAEKWRRV